MKRKFSFIFCITMIINLATFSQSFSELYEGYKDLNGVNSGELNFRIESISFFRNNEYKGDLVDGYTLTGEMLKPTLTYSFTKDLYIETGAHLLKYHGRDEYHKVLPWFTVSYNLSEHVRLVMGGLDQNKQHGLSEHLWEPERIYTDDPEEGLQFLYSGNNLDIQTWLSWEQFILKDDPFQEHFTVGISGKDKLISNSNLSLSIPLQVLFYHKGGEIDQSPLPVQTHSNFATGWEMELPAKNKWFNSVSLNGKWFGFHSVSNTNQYPFDDGHAYLLDLHLNGENGKLSLSYWNAFQFIAPNGREIYQSVSSVDETITEQDRSLLTFKYLWQKEIVKDARIAFQLDAYYDLKNPDISYSYSVYLLISGDFFLHRF